MNTDRNDPLALPAAPYLERRVSCGLNNFPLGAFTRSEDVHLDAGYCLDAQTLIPAGSTRAASLSYRPLSTFTGRGQS